MSHAPKMVPAEELALSPHSGWRRLPLFAGVVGALGIVAAALLGRGQPAFYFAWLVAVLFYLSVALGALFFVLTHHATKAGWGVVVRRLAENISATIPVLFVLFAVPVWLGMHDLYHWSDAEAVAHDHVLQGKQGYLNPTFFWVRAVACFGIWSLMALWFRGASRRQDASGDERLSRRMILWSYPSLVVFALTVTFAAFDWIMSLTPHWYSTIFGVYFFSGSVVGGFAGLVLLALALGRSGYLRNAVSIEHFHDLGKLLFTFMIFWSYIAFAQFFLIWYGNIPEETIWFLDRLQGGWRTVTFWLAVGHFGVPFFFLMPRTIKRRHPLILTGATWMLLVHLLDIHWLVVPAMPENGGGYLLLELLALLGVGGVAVAALGWLLAQAPLVPIRDPRLHESLAFENF